MTHPVPSSNPPNPSPLFDALVETQYGRLCGFAYRFVRSRDIAEDIVQDVLSELWCRWSEFDVRDPLPYLYQAIRNRAANHQRQRSVRDRFRDRVAAEATDRAAATGTAAQLESNDLAAALGRAVDALPERCRLVFTMSREGDLTYAEIAHALGISVKTVETHMTRALRLLRAQLSGYLALAVALAAASSWR